MAEKYSSIKWFLEELPKLKSLGILDEPTGEKLKAHYQERLAKAPSMQNFFLMMLVAVGALLICCGLIMLFAFNWDMLPKAVRIGVAFTPLILAGGLAAYTLVKDKNQPWREASALGVSAGIAILTALISQIYNTGGTLAQFMMLVLGLSLPLIYVFNSRALASAYTIGLFMLLPEWNCRNAVTILMNVVYLAAILPYVFHHLRGDDTISKVWMRYLCLPLAMFMLINATYGSNSNPVFLIFATAALLYYAGVMIRDDKEGYFSNPWLTTSYIAITIMLAVGTSAKECWDIPTHIYLRDMGQSTALIYWGHEFILAAGLLLLAVLDFMRLKFSAEKAVTALLPLFTLLPFIIGIKAMPTLTNFYFVAFAVILLVEGFRKHSLLVFNGGVLQLIILILCRFFDSKLGILEKGIAFIIIGIAFIVTNVVIGRKFKANAEVKNV